MNRPRDSLLTLFDPLFSGDPVTPRRDDAPSPDLGSDKENAAPTDDASDGSITLTKFFNRIYTRRKAHQSPRPLSRGRLIDLGDADASDKDGNDDDVDNDSDSDDGRREQQHGLVLNHESLLLPTGREGEARDSPQRRPLADIALGDGGSSPFLAMKKSPSRSPLMGMGTPSSSLFGSPAPFKLASPTPAPSSSPLASVINAINGTTSRSPSPSPPSTPSAPRIAVTPAEPSSPSPTGRQLRPDTMLRASPDFDVDVDPLRRRTSVDLQEAMSVHFDESSSFDLLKDKILFPENDSLDGDLDLDLGSAPATKVLADMDQGDIIVTPIAAAAADAESENEVDCVALLEERLRDINIMEDQNKDEDRDTSVSTPPAQFSSCDIPTPQAPVRQFLRPPKNEKMQVSAAPTVTCNNTPPAPPLPRRRSVRSSITSIPPKPASTSMAPQITKKERAKPGPTMTAPGIPARKPVGGAVVHSAHPQPRSQLVPPRASASTMALGGVQRPPASALANVAHSRAASVSSSGASMRMQSQPQPQRNRPIGAQAAPSSSKVSVASAGGLRRPSGLPAPTTRGGGASGIAVRRASISAGAGGATRLSMLTSTSTAGGGGRLGSTGVSKIGPVKGHGHGASVSARIMRRV